METTTGTISRERPSVSGGYLPPLADGVVLSHERSLARHRSIVLVPASRQRHDGFQRLLRPTQVAVVAVRLARFDSDGPTDDLVFEDDTQLPW